MSRKTGLCLWTPVPQEDPAPPDRYKHTCCIHGSNIYLLGGRGKTMLNDFWKYNVVRNEWANLGYGCEEPLEQASMVANKHLLYIFGGMIDGPYSKGKNPFWLYDTDMEQWKHFQGKDGESLSRTPSNRKGHSAVVFEDAMFIFGGYVDLIGASGEFWRFGFDSSVWSSLTPSQRQMGPGPRHGHSAVVHLDGMYIYGGQAALKDLGDFWRWSFTRCSWSSIKFHSGPSQLVGHSAVVYKGNMLLFGGSSGQYLKCDDLWRFSFAHQTWKKLATLTKVSPPSMAYHCSVGLGSRFETQTTVLPAPLNLHRSKSGKDWFNPFHCLPDALSQPIGPIEESIPLETFCFKDTSDCQEDTSFCERQADGSSPDQKVRVNEVDVTSESQGAFSRGMETEGTLALEESMLRHPDVMLVMGGKNHHENARISVWQMTLSDL